METERPALTTPAEPARGTAAPPRPIVEVKGLVKTYGDMTAVGGISFAVPPGEVFGFIGPNGAGKTTTLRILATLLDPTAGQVLVDGYCVENDTEEVRRIIGYMPDHFGVYEGITVEEYLDFFGAAYGIPSARRRGMIADVMELTDLGRLKSRMVATLSKGMRQRLCLAKTLVHDPRVLILDEPASALDPRARIEMRGLLKELGRMGKTIIISSHILTELSDLCTSVAILEKGRLVESGNVALLGRKQVRADRIKITLHEPRPELADVLAALPSVSAVNAEDGRILFDYTGAPEDFYKVVKELTDREAPLLAVEREARNLEHLFLELTEGDVQ